MQISISICYCKQNYIEMLIMVNNYSINIYFNFDLTRSSNYVFM